MEATGNGRPVPVPADYGDFVGSDDEFEVMDMAEGWGKYGNGYFYPVCIGNVLKNQFRVDHKLGHGGFSVVWLAHDLKNCKDVALKILHSGRDTDREYETHLEVSLNVRDPSRLVLCQDTFVLKGSHGNHRVLVLPLRGPTLASSLTKASKTIAARMLAMRQLLQAVASLHNASLVHRGEF